MMGRTIKNEINTDRLCDENKISAKMMNDATGIERTASMAGASSSSIRRKCADNAANHVPNIIPTIKPKAIRHNEYAIAFQKFAVTLNCANRTNT